MSNNSSNIAIPKQRNRIYAIVANGGSIEFVIAVFNTELEARTALSQIVEADCDDYHTYSIDLISWGFIPPEALAPIRGVYDSPFTDVTHKTIFAIKKGETL